MSDMKLLHDDEFLRLENKELKEELNILKEKYQLKDYLLNHIPAPVWMIDKEYRYTYLSPSFVYEYENLTGIKPELGVCLFDTIRNDYYKKLWKEILQKVFAGEKQELQDIHEKNNTRRYFHIVATPINPEGKEITSAFVYIQEITLQKVAEEKSLASAFMFQHFIHQSRDCYYETDLGGKILEVSPAIKNLISYTREELIGKEVFNLYKNIEDRQLFLKKIIQDEKVSNYQLELLKKDGRVKNIAVNASLITDLEQGQKKIAGIIRDITETEKINKKLTWLKRAIEHSPISIIIVNTSGIIEYVNPFFTKITGYNEEEVIGQKPSILKSGMHDDIFYKNMWNTVLSGDVWQGEIFNKRKDGSFYWEQALIAPVKDNKDNIVNLIALNEDITEKKKQETEFKQLKLFNIKVVNTINEGIMMKNEAGIISFINPSFSRMTGYQPQDLYCLQWDHLIPGKYHDAIKGLEHRETQNIRESVEIEVIRKDGKIIPVYMSSSPIIENKQYKGSVIVFSDISQLKQKETELKKALKKARTSDKLKSSFLANMSHEIRTPMNAILGFAEILRQERDLEEPKREEYFSIIEQKGNELLQIISDIIDISKIEAKIINVKEETFDLRCLLNSIRTSFQKELEISGKENHIKLNLSIPDQSSEILMYSDQYRLRQILVNLLNNAKKFTEAGEINFGYIRKKHKIEFRVKDTGIGIAKENHKIIFKRFRQADDNYTRSFGGTGLGLNICKNLVEMLGGEIWVESEPGKGSVFYFTIPDKAEHC